MIKMTKKNSIVGLSLFIALILALFPTSDFISRTFIVDTNLKQQHFNEAGIFTVTPFEAAQYYSYDPSKCYWIDVRDAKDFSKEHLKASVNENMKQLGNASFAPDNIILIYGNNTGDAQDAAAYLRQVKNARAFAVKGGFTSVKKYLIDPIGLSISNQFSDKDLSTLVELRNKLSGQNVSPEQLLDKLKSSKSKAIREGC